MKLSQIIRAQANLIEALENQGEGDYNVRRIALPILELIVMMLKLQTN